MVASWTAKITGRLLDKKNPLERACLSRPTRKGINYRMPKTDEDLEGGRDGAASKQENDSAPKTLFGLPMKTAQVR